MKTNDYKFLKTVSLNDLPEEAWQYIQGGPVGGEDLQTYYKTIPWLYRGIDIRANGVASMPFSIYQGEDEVDNSEDYQNVLKFLPNPGALFGLIEAALTMWGYAYCFRMKTAFNDQKGLRYLLPSSVKPQIDKDTGEVSFKRSLNGKVSDYSVDDIVYFWKYDPFVEIGPPSSSPATSAANACGVLLNVDEFAKQFFKQGAVKTTLLTTTDIQPAERERLKSWWKRVLGMEKAWKTEIVNAKTVTPVTIGEGLESLQDNDLTEAKRIDIAAALGIPYSVLFSNASNRATAEQDDMHLYTKTIIPECEFIEECLNTQVFEPLGYKLNFDPEELDIFQEDENARAASLTQLITALDKPEEFLIAADILGYEINEEQKEKIIAMISEKNARREQMVEQLTQSKPEEEPEEDDEEERPQDTRSIALEKWRTKSINRVKAKRKAACPFNDQSLDPVTIASISGALETCETITDVDAVFSGAWIGYP